MPRSKCVYIMMKSFARRSSGRRPSPLAKGEVGAATPANEMRHTRPHVPSQEMRFAKRKPSDSVLSPVEDNRLKCKFEAIDVLLQILLHQDELTLKEYTINDSKIKVLVIEDTEF